MIQTLLGIDIGTTGCKVGLYNAKGESVYIAYREYGTLFPGGGRAEELPELWWEHIRSSIREVLVQTGTDPAGIAGMGISCTNALIPVDREGNALCNAIMQMDSRSQPQTERIVERFGHERLFALASNRAAPGTCWAPVILWLRENEPELYGKCHKFLSPGGYITRKLTGCFSIDLSRASTTLLFDVKNCRWSDELCRSLDIPLSLLPDVYCGGDIVGGVTAGAAELTGLRADTPVTAGVMDTVAGMVGAGVVCPGELLVIMGTVARCCFVLPSPEFDPRLINSGFLSPDSWLTLSASNGCGISVRWFKEAFCREESDRALRDSVSPYRLIDELAASAPPGSEGLIYLPYLNGERTPIWDAHARGVFFGFSPKHQKAHFARAILEGVAYAIRQNLDIIEDAGRLNIPSVRLCGGGSASPLWRQIVADVLGKPVNIVKQVDTEPLGSALIAAKGVGVTHRTNAIPQLLTNPVAPSQRHTDRYAGYYEIYKRLYPQLSSPYADLHRQALTEQEGKSQ